MSFYSNVAPKRILKLRSDKAWNCHRCGNLNKHYMVRCTHCKGGARPA